MKKSMLMHFSGVGAIGLISAAAFFLQIQPTIDRQHTARAEMVELAGAKQEASTSELAVQSLKRSLKEAQAAAEREPHLDPVTRLNTRLAKFSEVATAYQLQIDSLEPGEQKIEEKHIKAEIRMTGRGSYKQLAMFLNKCNTVMPDTAVTELNLNAPPSGDNNATFSATFWWFAAKR